jgi:hypothetical protein
MKRFTSASGRLALLALLALLIAAACNSSPAASNLGGGIEPTPSATHVSGATLEAIALKADDIGPDALEESVPKGDVVADQVTLDLCGASFKSEALRTARLQVAFKETIRRMIVSNEVVFYRTGGTRQAYAELRRVASHCPRSVKITGATASHVRVESRDGRLVPRQLTVSALFSPSRTEHVWSVGVYQFDGNLFSGVYVFAGTRAVALRQARRLARASAERLQAVQ